jgi:6-phosphogluconolactonase
MRTPEHNVEYFFDTRDEASMAAAKRISAALTRRLDTQSEASLVVSGGTSPTKCLAELSRSDVDWQRVYVLLSDERWVSAEDEDSNEKLVRETLLQDRATEARLLPVYDRNTDIADRCEALDEEIRRLPTPFACSLLGMGEDGHFASLFPGADNLEQGLDVDGPRLCMPVVTAASPHPRVSLTLAALSRSDQVVLLIFGAAKREIYERATSSGNTYPVSRLLLQKRAPVHVYWAP